MSDGTTLIGSRIDADLYARFKDWVDERHGGVNTHLRYELENALENHMELSETGEGELHTTLLREEIEALREEVGQLSEDGTQKEKTKTGITVEERANEIETRLFTEFSGATISETAVETVIREVAGGSAPTIRQYRNILLNEGELWENPNPKKTKDYVIGDENYVEFVQQLSDTPALNRERYEAAVDQMGKERYREIKNQIEREEDKGFE